MPSLIGRCGGGGGSASVVWATIEKHFGIGSPMTLTNYPDVSYNQNVDWTGGELRTNSPTVFTWNNANPQNLTIGNDGTDRAYWCEAYVETNTDATGTSILDDLLAVFILPDSDRLNPFLFSSVPVPSGQGWRARYGGNAVPRVQTESNWLATRYVVSGGGYLQVNLENGQTPSGAGVHVDAYVTAVQMRVLGIATDTTTTDTSPLV